MTRTVAIAGSTGSIGTQTLEVIADAPDDYRVLSLSAGSSADQLVAQAEAVRPDTVVIGDPALVDQVRAGVPDGVIVLSGAEAMAECARQADVTVNGIVGFAGLGVTLACLEAGKRLALANKESLIAAGPVVQQARRTPGAELVPVDSEHAAIHMCLRANNNRSQVAKIQLTASGGPFRGRSRAELDAVTIDQALAHPTWSMGPKITIDSSTLMNKGLEVIEANELFGSPAGDSGYGITLDDVEVVVHPQSIVHSMATFSDGATIAQLSLPTMKLPIGYALAYPDRYETAHGAIDWATLGSLDFEVPDLEAFPCLALAFEAGRMGGTAPAWLNAANEIAVAAFLDERIRWIDIARVNEEVLRDHDGADGSTLDGVLEGDHEARSLADGIVIQLEKR
ncbi:MAG: 1-deoxy-D-xylulose-5-phosphate reductoisomerase [Acidimicrobiales bacterium]|jgi:1-deoxy-D-xylulose-5-phosphate reductoisomerase